MPLSIPPYVVRISGETYTGEVFNGTGFLVSARGHVSTCHHVVIHDEHKARIIRVHILGYGEPWIYQVCDSSKDDDLAILEGIVPPSVELTCAMLHEYWHRDADLGQELTICGHSSAKNYPAGQRFPCAISGFSEKDGRVGVTGAINSGDSGGPVIDDQNRVIGIIHAKDRIRDGQARFIPVSLLINLLRSNNITFKTVHKEDQKPCADLLPPLSEDSQSDVPEELKRGSQLSVAQNEAPLQASPATGLLKGRETATGGLEKKSWGGKHFAALVGLIVIIIIGGVFAYVALKRQPAPSPQPTEPPPNTTVEVTPVELDDEFLNLNKWTPPPTGWTIDHNDGQGRLVIEQQPQVGYATDIVYGDFEMSFNLKLLNQSGAAWALRIDKTGRNYYLFYLSGPAGQYPNRFLTYIVRDGAIDPKSERSTEVIAALRQGEQYQIDIKAEKNKITQIITPAETGVETKLYEFVDANNTFPRGSIGFRTVRDERFSIDDLFARPLSLQTPR